ncbi:MAG: hypothetical protein LBR25_09910 [Erysipelotrichaceae bacterium]|jgi:hypothetical protein|nr:hypothetical protein [Erysipelotrichaceae bacterium]
MQLKIYRRINQLIIGSMIGVLVGTAILLTRKDLSESSRNIMIASLIIIVVVAFFGAKMLENNWDKRMIQKMALNQQIALANIIETTRFMIIRDTSFRKYILWEFKVMMLDRQGNKREATFYDKVNASLLEIPKGTIYMTYDPDKPDRMFVIPNVIISHIPTLMPVVKKFESTKNFHIKYINVYYDGGLVFKTFKETLKEQKEAAS